MEDQHNKTYEILFELKVADVMNQNPITVGPTVMMSDLRNVLREHKISGVPVVEEGSLLGIISIEDLIQWLVDGGKERMVQDVMTRGPQCMYADQPLVHAIKKFDKLGYGRFPVLDSDTNRLIGIITKGAIIEGVLKQLEKEFKDEEVKRYRASHFFNDIMSDHTNVKLRFDVAGKDFDKAGSASTTMKKNLRRLGIRPDVIQRVAIASYEAEMNLVIYTDGGTMDFTITEEQIVILVKDSGPGIEDIKKAMEPGFTTADTWVKNLGFGSGMGLPNMKKCSDTMDIQSAPGKGTEVYMEIAVNKNVGIEP